MEGGFMCIHDQQSSVWVAWGQQQWEFGTVVDWRIVESTPMLRTNLKYANRKILISLFLYYVSIFTLSHIYNAQMTYAALCFSAKYLLPLLSLLIDPKYAVVPSCLFLSLVHMCDDNLQPHNDVVVHSVSCMCRWCASNVSIYLIITPQSYGTVLFCWNAEFLCRRAQCIQWSYHSKVLPSFVV